MQSFLTFLTEAAADPKKLTHLEHAEDLHLNSGAEGYQHAVKTLHSVHRALTGQQSDSHITTKFDGSPSLVFGHHPTTGKFFVASKSAFNKNPKINYTNEDIERNHGHAAGLVEKLKHALKHLPKVAPEKGVYQGDVMYSGKDVKASKDQYHFTPNTLTYSVDKGTTEGRKVANAKFGIVVHTQYKGKDLESMTAGFQPNTKSFRDHPDVHLIDHNVDTSSAKLHPEHEKQFMAHMDQADQIHKKLQKGGYDAVTQHTVPLKTYINTTVRTGDTPTVQGYINHVTKKGQAEVKKLKTEKGQSARQTALDMQTAIIKQHKNHLQNALDMHQHIQKAKDILVNGLATTGGIKTSANGQDTKGEGYVATVNGTPTKLVDRSEFSKLNFARGDALKQKPKSKTAVMTFGRMNPPTTGHEKLVEKVKQIAKENDAHHEVIMSHSQDAKKNPLTAEEKLKHAKRAFPDTNLKTSSKEEPTFLQHAARLNKEGHDHLIMVAGSDRVDEYKQKLNQYNGTHDKALFNFKKIEVRSAGQRDPDAEGAEGMSASKMRAHVAAGEKEHFMKGAPSKMSDKHKEEMYNNLRKSMGHDQ